MNNIAVLVEKHTTIQKNIAVYANKFIQYLYKNTVADVAWAFMTMKTIVVVVEKYMAIQKIIVVSVGKTTHSTLPIIAEILTIAQKLPPDII